MKSKHIVFVHGLFGWGEDEMGGFPYWGKAKKQFNGFTPHVANCGPISSFHDRACEVFAQINGSKVDYGKEHSETEEHAQFSDDFSISPSNDLDRYPFVPEWSSENPVILIGHSAGAQTCMQLQQLLADDYWNIGSNADWIEAIICVAGVLNGSTLPYALGCDKQTGILKGTLGNVIGKGFQIAAWSLDKVNSTFYDFDLDQWLGKDNLDHHDNLLDVLRKSKFSRTDRTYQDNLAYDLSLQGCLKANEKFKTNPNTYYFSVVTSQTNELKALDVLNIQVPNITRINLMLLISALKQATFIPFDNDDKPIPGWGTGKLDMAQWLENDGAVSTISQCYPFTGGSHHDAGGEEGFINKPALTKGKWYFETAKAIAGQSFDHLDVVFGYQSELLTGMENAHIKLYQELCKLLKRLA